MKEIVPPIGKNKTPRMSVKLFWIIIIIFFVILQVTFFLDSHFDTHVFSVILLIAFLLFYFWGFYQIQYAAKNCT